MSTPDNTTPADDGYRFDDRANTAPRALPNLDHVDLPAGVLAQADQAAALHRDNTPLVDEIVDAFTDDV